MKIRLLIILILLSFSVTSYSQEFEDEQSNELLEEKQISPDVLDSYPSDDNQEPVQELDLNSDEVLENQEINNDEGYGSDDEEYYGAEESSIESNQFN